MAYFLLPHYIFDKPEVILKSNQSLGAGFYYFQQRRGRELIAASMDRSVHRRTESLFYSGHVQRDSFACTAKVEGRAHPDR